VKAPFAGTLQRIASIPWAYDRIQALAGSARVRRFLASQLATLGDTRMVRASELTQVIAGHFRITDTETFSVYHEYYFCGGSKPVAGASST
jgi:hypothetical protein